ncbi:apolipoprotein N-acyltransferase [Aeromonas veronii]|uniref:apolipoprotein N-acyltransferase n=1 Tax=Aeromonas veronii TaxID=654 RepID=UPI0028D927C6|nr:apolipoprotein N-acyltransferase [Aeromonas veronii]HEA3125280.1 apolipoprotein N-acyltransferase [Aeromonas veronii]
MKSSPVTSRILLSLSALASGAIAVLAFSPFGYWPLVIPSLLGLYALLDKATPKQAAWRGFGYAMGLFLPGLWWIHVSMTEFGGIPLPVAFVLLAGLSAYLALYPMLACWVFARFFGGRHWSRWLLAFPALWLVADWLRGWVMTGFPWLWFGYSQIDGPLKGFAPILGVQGITLALLFSASAIWLVWKSRSPLWLAVPAMLVAGAHGLMQLNWVTRGEPVKVALVQGNIAQSLKWDPEALAPTVRTYQDLSRENQDADIIIWPESAIPAIEKAMGPYLENLDKAMKVNDTGLLAGIIHYDEQQQRFYNTVLGMGVQDADGKASYFYNHSNRYNKYHLLPIGEFVPFEDLLRPIAPFFNLPMSSFSRGDEVQPNLIAKGLKLAAAICYEIIFPEEVRRNVNADTDFLLTVSNDAWFGTSIGPWQHMEIARMRALELARPLLRDTNTGITIVTEIDGSIIGQIPQFEAGVLRSEVRPAHGETPYLRFGSWPLYGLTVLLLGLALALRPKAHPWAREL